MAVAHRAIGPLDS